MTVLCAGVAKNGRWNKNAYARYIGGGKILFSLHRSCSKNARRRPGFLKSSALSLEVDFTTGESNFSAGRGKDCCSIKIMGQLSSLKRMGKTTHIVPVQLLCLIRIRLSMVLVRLKTGHLIIEIPYIIYRYTARVGILYSRELHGLLLHVWRKCRRGDCLCSLFEGKGDNVAIMDLRIYPEARQLYWKSLNKGIFSSIKNDGWWLDSIEHEHVDPKPSDFDLPTHLGTYRSVKIQNIRWRKRGTDTLSIFSNWMKILGDKLATSKKR